MLGAKFLAPKSSQAPRNRIQPRAKFLEPKSLNLPKAAFHSLLFSVPAPAWSKLEAEVSSPEAEVRARGTRFEETARRATAITPNSAPR